MLKKFGGKLIYFYKKGIVSSQEPEVPTIPTITSDDMEGLEYLSGYVISKFLKKYEGTVFSDLIHSLQVGSDDTQILIATQNRGGLATAAPMMVDVFKIAELMFGRKSGIPGTHMLDTQKMVKYLLQNVELLSKFNTLTQDISMEDEIKHIILSKMLSLYLRVRSFSFSKKVVSEYRQKYLGGKEKALRKSLVVTNEPVN